MDRRLLFLFLLTLAACAPQDSAFKAKSVISTDPTITPENPVVIDTKATPFQNDPSPNLLGYLSGTDWKVERKGSKLTVSVQLQLAGDKSSNVRWRKAVTLSGTLNPGGATVLRPESDDANDLKVRSRVTCSSAQEGNDCDLAIIDVFVRDGEKIHAAQYLATLESASPTQTTPAVSNPSSTQTPGSKPKAETTTPGSRPAPKAGKVEAPTSAPAQKKDEPAQPMKPTDPVKPAPTVEPTKPAPNAPGGSPKPNEPAKPAPAVQPAKPAPPNEPAKTDDNDDEEELGTSENEGVDPEDHPSIYIGTLHDDAKDLFEDLPSDRTPPKKDEPGKKPAPTPQPPKPAPQPSPVGGATPSPSTPRPRDQVIGFPNKGRLQNATSLRTAKTPITILNPGRDRAWASWELVQILDQLAKAQPERVRVGDMSQKNGGKIVNSRHASHQSGQDADVAYPVSNGQVDFASLVHASQVSSSLKLEATWAMFKVLDATGAVDRIFVDNAIKHALCDIAKKHGEFESKSELLRKLRPADGHDTHFHLRIRCSTQHPQCRMMGPPPAGPGC